MGSALWVMAAWLGASLLLTVVFAIGAGMGYRRRLEEARGAGLEGLFTTSALSATPPGNGLGAGGAKNLRRAGRVGGLRALPWALGLAGLASVLGAAATQGGADWRYWLGLALLVVAAAGWASQRQARRTHALRSSYAMLRRMVDSASDLLIIVDRAGRMIYVSPSAERVLGRATPALAGSPVSALVHPGDAAILGQALAGEPGLAAGRAWLDVRMQHGDGSWRHLEVAVSDLLDDPHVRGIVLSARDATERRVLEARLLHESLHDPVTGLSNGAALAQRIGDALSGDRTGLAVMVIDLDRFKFVNDAYGHDAGDLALRTISERLQACLRPGDMLARPDDGDFAMLCERVRDPARALAIAERLLDAVREPQRIGDEELVVTATVGVAVLSDGGRAPEDVLQDAHMAMRRAKRAGGSRCELYVPAWRVEGRNRVRTESALRGALERRELRLLYEPIVDLPSGRIVGVEALLRWHHHARGLVPPSEFLPLAEQTGIIVPIGAWVVRRACEQFSRWLARHPELDTVAVNVSPAQLADDTLAAAVGAALGASRLPASSLTLEVTEAAMVRPASDVIRRLGAVKALGVKLAIDDFGTGYSSLGHMQELPVDVLKIDRCFIRELDAEDGTEAIVGAVVGLAHTMGLVTVAEGVETRAQLEKLAQLGCKRAQGRFYSASRTAASMGRLLRAQTVGAPGAAFIALDDDHALTSGSGSKV